MKHLALANTINKFVINKSELYEYKDSIASKGVSDTLEGCLNFCTCDGKSKSLFEIDSVVDYLHDELNTGHWSDVPINVRRCFSVASFAKMLIMLQTASEFSLELLQKALKCIDLGLLLGAPLNENSDLLTDIAKYLSCKISELNNSVIVFNTVKRLKLDEDLIIYNNLNAKEINYEECPSMELFDKIYFKAKIPVKLKSCMKHWPASTKWLDVNYILKIAGDRTVPIEIGSHYVDENWSQKLMTLKDFIHKHYLSDDDGDIGYLAQHNLFEQISELKNDICIPEYCALSLDYDNCIEPDINAWFGPKGTVSPLHFDPKDNILAQVYGTKQIILFSSEDTKYLYPHESNLLFNTSQVDPINPNLLLHEEFTKATMYKCLLEPGDMLYIPLKWWHHVTALDKSFSVSFWWK
ncbi:unnamed protein product [Brassicogethes aeneus]|uniref:JmjC domain-containing protein n=1 Tax=Brassicogethes aeneus TaxID=1431903 RepID=A0A9P0AQW6_BRAAE|nr:unnamed protein product [Brassicogethes aeneus]